jgi:hypothetical protein
VKFCLQVCCKYIKTLQREIKRKLFDFVLLQCLGGRNRTLIEMAAQVAKEVEMRRLGKRTFPEMQKLVSGLIFQQWFWEGFQ